jgi:general secretion pathway protein H
VFAVDVNKRAFGSSAADSVPLDPALDISLLTAKSELIGESTGGIRFFPDGSSSGGRIELRLRGDRAAVNVRWSTGTVTLER